LSGKKGSRLEDNFRDYFARFKIFGPTCDTLDVLPRPLMLPKTIQQDDYIVLETVGAYSIAIRTGFNGFYPDDWAIIDGD